MGFFSDAWKDLRDISVPSRWGEAFGSMDQFRQRVNDAPIGSPLHGFTQLEQGLNAGYGMTQLGSAFRARQAYERIQNGENPFSREFIEGTLSDNWGNLGDAFKTNWPALLYMAAPFVTGANTAAGGATGAAPGAVGATPAAGAGAGVAAGTGSQLAPVIVTGSVTPGVTGAVVSGAAANLPSQGSGNSNTATNTGTQQAATTNGFTDFLNNMGIGSGTNGSGIAGTNITWGNVFSGATALYGLYQSQQQMDMAEDAMAQQNPFGPYRAQYANELANVMRDPNSIINRPGYQFQMDQGLQALNRSMAAQGFLGSGNQATAVVKYGQDYATNYLNNYVQQLATLAGAGIAPNAGAALQGYSNGVQTANESLASLGYLFNRPTRPTPTGPNANMGGT